MKILLAVNNPSDHLFPLPTGWADRGHAVDVVMDSADGRFGHAMKHVHDGMRLLTLSHGESVMDALTGEPTALRLEELVRSADAVVIGGYATRVARHVVRHRSSSNARFVLLAERPAPREAGPRRWIRDNWVRQFMSQVHSIWSMSEAGDQAYSRLGKAPEARIPYPIVVPPRSPDFPNVVAQKWSPQQVTRIVVLGQLIERKRPLAALHAARSMQESGLNVEVEVLGTGPLKDEVTIAATGLPVILRGHVPIHEVEKTLGASNLLIHPAHHDGWGMSVTEAACRGVPVVATAGCDSATEVAARTSSVRITDGSPSGMARAAHELIRDFRSDPVGRSLDLVRAVEEVCGADRIVERSLGALQARR